MAGSIEDWGLPIPAKYYLQVSGGNTERKYILAVHINWIRQVILENKLPSDFPTHDTLTDDQVFAFISQGKSQPLGPFWLFLHVTIHSLSQTVKSFRRLDSTQVHSAATIPIPGSKCKTWSQTVDFIGESNFNYVWEQPEIRLLDLPVLNNTVPASDIVELSEDNYFEQVLQILYVNHKSSTSTNPQNEGTIVSTEEPVRFSIANLAQPLSILRKNDFVILLNLYTEHTLQDCVNFSPHKLSSSNVKQLFILYQLLQLTRDMESLNIPTGNITLSDIWTDESLFITVMPNIREILQRLQIQKQQSITRSAELDDFLQHCVSKVKSSSSDCDVQDATPALIESVIRHWCEGLVTNYEYLMFLNYLAGRHCNVNPNYHPVFPWVCDFSVKNGGWRDLTKSKFRLNKGERQLDLMYEEKGPCVGTSVPHHVTDILSEITYYVYKARQTSKEVLCKFVRPKWVPAEYPSSVQRIFEWTPDECIPEFFDDPNIFTSIHEDLPDLQPPAWAPTPTEFIKQHRDLLESDNVSSKLHHWIDHTFGYKLSGNPAVKSKNIYLSLVDHHQHLAKTGIVQLFQVPHPPKKSQRRNIKNIVKYSELRKMREYDTGPEKEYITLPRHYDPSGFLNDFEVCLKFFSTHFNNMDGIVLKNLKSSYSQNSDHDKNREAEEHSPYVKLFGCLLIELVLPNKVHFVSSKLRNIDERFNFYRKIVRTLEPIPIFIKRTLQVIFTPKHSFDFSIPLRISVELLLLDSGLSPIPFPKYFDSVYKLVRSLRNYDNSLKTSDPSDLSFRLKVEELKVKSFSRDLIQILNDLDEDGLDLVMPFVLELFRDHNTRVLAVWNLFCPFSRAIGREKSVKNLLQPIIQIYESDYNSDKHLKLFHRSFLLQLKSCFGLEMFLENFVTLLIEAIGGWKHSETSSTNPTPTHLKSFHEIEETRSKPTFEQRASSVADSISADSSAEPQIFIMDQDSSDAEDTPPITNPHASRTLSSSNISIAPRLSLTSSDVPCGESAEKASSYDTKSIGSTTESDITEMCCESVIWLVHRLGPVLSAKYVSKNLLRMLTLCYLGHLDKVDYGACNKYPCHGDSHAEKVLECLISISDLYGDSFLERQYIPYAVDVVNSAKKKMSLTLEAALVGISSLLQRVFAYMDDSLLVSLLNGPVIDSLVKPILDLITSLDVQFPSGSGPRSLLVNKMISMLNAIRRKIGPDISQQTLKPLILQLCFRIQNNTASDPSDENKVNQNFPAVFGPSLAHLIYTHFYAMIVGSDYEIMIHDMVLIFGQVPTVQKDSSAPGEKLNPLRKVEMQSSFGSRSFGNRISVQENELSSAMNEMSSSFSASPPKDTTRHLKGNWSIYWDHEFGRSESKFNFKQIKLQTFSGHTAPVRCIWSLNNENSFLTGSKDKTCRVFSLRNQGDESTVASSKWTYTHHKKAVLSVLFSEPLHLAASTDGNIHIWDPFVGKLVRILETSLGKSIRCLKPLPNFSSFVGAGIENFVTVVDPRSCQAYELKIGIGQNTGLVRCMSVSPSGDVVSVGHSSGMISSLDLRFGSLLGSWKAHEGEILQLITLKERRLISSSLDQAISVWNLDDNKLAFNMRGSTEPVHSMTTFESELITCTTSNRIGVHNRIDANSDFSSTRLRSDSFKGIVTAFNLLPLNQVLLLGGDSGLVYLLC